MLSFARLCLLAVSLALLFHVSLGAQLQYTIYNSTTCQNSLSSGTDNSANYVSNSGLNVWTSTNCLKVNNVPNVGSTTLSCTTGSQNVQGMAVYTDGSCSTRSTTITAASTGGSGSCAQIQNSGVATGLSFSVTCNQNGAFAMAALSLPLMALLALVAVVSM